MDSIQLIALVAMFTLIVTIRVRSLLIKFAAFVVLAISGIASGWLEPVFIASAGLLLVVALWAREQFVIRCRTYLLFSCLN